MKEKQTKNKKKTFMMRREDEFFDMEHWELREKKEMLCVRAGQQKLAPNSPGITF